MTPAHSQRRCGLLLHPTSLPGPGGLGSLGASAHAFADLLERAGQTVWQVLPLGPTGYGDSPYSAYSAFAGNPLLIDLEQLVAEGDLSAADLPQYDGPTDRADYGFAYDTRLPALARAACTFFAGPADDRHRAFDHFCRTEASWLDSYALFQALRAHLGHTPWTDWPLPLRRRDPAALAQARQELADPIRIQQYMQFVFDRQWHRLRQAANARGIALFGDLPIFVALDSADVWAHPELFLLDRQGRPTHVAGVPPDYFSTTGQRWGNPLYRWDTLKAQGYRWWIDRCRRNFDLYDLVRIDHFRGFAACWAVPAAEETAIHGRWRSGPGAGFFTALREALGELPLVAEDLGVITPDVEALRDDFALPGMKIMQFAFDSGPDNPYLPWNIPPRSVIYTGTHDNDTLMGWWQGLREDQRQRVRDDLGRPLHEPAWELIHAALSSVAELCILPIQDLLGLGSSGRMNTPGKADGNWRWRLTEQPPDLLAERLHTLVQRTNRLAAPDAG